MQRTLPMAKGTLLSLVAGLALLAQAVLPATAQQLKCALPLPNGYGWPKDPVELWKISGGILSKDLTIPGAIDTPAQRSHGWMLFAAATQTTDGLPVFHTWYTVEEAFDNGVTKIDCNKRNTLQLTLPTQLVMAAPNPARDAAVQSGLDPSPRFDPNFEQLQALPSGATIVTGHEGVVAFSHVAFNQDMYDWLRDNQYFRKADLDKLLSADVARKQLVPLPATAVSLKFSWWPVAPSGLTPLPVWDNDPRFPGDAKNPPMTWKRVVVVDPIGGQVPPAKVKLGEFEHTSPKVVPLDKFYFRKISKEEAQLANADFRLRKAANAVLGRTLKEGDFIVMTALHVATREFEPWVFTTFWWNDDAQNNSLGSDMPSQVIGPFRNYIMDVSYNINSPRMPNGSAPISMNPWLELFQLGGVRSQCMACHARAAYGPKVQAFFNPKDMSTADPNGFNATPQSADDLNFRKGTLDLQRVWTIFTRAE